MKPINKNTYALVACVIAMTLLCFLSIDSPIRFDRQKEERETAVKVRLVKIRAAEEAYRRRYGAYTGSFDILVSKGLLADSLRFIPFASKKPFKLTATVTMGKSGRQIPMMECSAEYGQYLEGLDEAAVTNLVEEANESGRFPGLKIGDLETPNNNAGNWE